MTTKRNLIVWLLASAAAATFTDLCESVIKIAGNHLVVGQMRNGKSPSKTCKIAVKMIAEKQNNNKTFQVGFVAINKHVESGAFAI